MRKIALCLFAVVLATMTVSANKKGLHYYAVSDAKDYLTLAVGPNYMFGDMGGADFQNMWVTEWDVAYTRPSIALDYQHDWNQYVGTRIGAMYSMFAGNDDNSRNERTYEYYSNSVELSIQMLAYLYHGRLGRYNYDLYAFGGFGYVWYDTFWKHGEDESGKALSCRTTTTKNGQPVDVNLENLDGVSYNSDKNMWEMNSHTWAIPFGVGIHFPITQKLYLGAEFGWRYLVGQNADYMDGMKTYWSDMDDTYANLMFTLTYRLMGEENCYAKYGRGQYHSLNRRR